MFWVKVLLFDDNTSIALRVVATRELLEKLFEIMVLLCEPERYKAGKLWLETLFEIIVDRFEVSRNMPYVLLLMLLFWIVEKFVFVKFTPTLKLVMVQSLIVIPSRPVAFTPAPFVVPAPVIELPLQLRSTPLAVTSTHVPVASMLCVKMHALSVVAAHVVQAAHESQVTALSNGMGRKSASNSSANLRLMLTRRGFLNPTPFSAFNEVEMECECI